MTSETTHLVISTEVCRHILLRAETPTALATPKYKDLYIIYIHIIYIFLFQQLCSIAFKKNQWIPIILFRRMIQNRGLIKPDFGAQLYLKLDPELYLQKFHFLALLRCYHTVYYHFSISNKNFR